MSNSVVSALTAFVFLAVVAGCDGGGSSGAPSAGGSGVGGVGGGGQGGTSPGGSAGAGGSAGVGGNTSPPISRPIALDGVWYAVELVDESEVFGLNLDGLDENGVACLAPGTPPDHPGGVDKADPAPAILTGVTPARRLFENAVMHVNRAGQVAVYGGYLQGVVANSAVNGSLDSPVAAGRLLRELDNSPQLVWLDGPVHSLGQVTAVSVGVSLSLSGGVLEAIVGAVVPNTAHNRGMFGSESCNWLMGWADSAVNAGSGEACDGISTGARLVATEIPALSDSNIGPEESEPVVCE